MLPNHTMHESSTLDTLPSPFISGTYLKTDAIFLPTLATLLHFYISLSCRGGCLYSESFFSSFKRIIRIKRYLVTLAKI